MSNGTHSEDVGRGPPHYKLVTGLNSDTNYTFSIRMEGDSLNTPIQSGNNSVKTPSMTSFLLFCAFYLHIAS